MRVVVNGEERELTCILDNGVDCATDIFGNTTSEYIYNEEHECKEITEESYQWWNEYLSNLEKDEERKYEIIYQYGWNAWEKAFDENFMANDLEDEHKAMELVFSVFE